jgi:undecaprenyl-diphosphatase
VEGGARIVRGWLVRLGRDDERYFVRPRRTLRLGAGLLSLFALLALFVPAEPLGFEQHWQEWMSDIQTPFLEHVALVFNYLGRGIGEALVLAGVGGVLALAARWRALLAFAVAEGLALLLSSLVKASVGRQRPPDGLVHPISSSFPSGHTAFAGATCVALVVLFTEVGPRRWLWWSLAVLGTAAMGWSRTYLQVHWLLDVLAGALLSARASRRVCSRACRFSRAVARALSIDRVPTRRPFPSRSAAKDATSIPTVAVAGSSGWSSCARGVAGVASLGVVARFALGG